MTTETGSPIYEELDDPVWILRLLYEEIRDRLANMVPCRELQSTKRHFRVLLRVNC